MSINLLKNVLRKEVDAEKPESRYIFLVGSRDLGMSLFSTGAQAVIVSNEHLNIADFKAAIMELVPGTTNILNYIFAPCLSKKQNADVISFLKKEGYSVAEDAWRIFRGKDYLANFENQEILKQTVQEYINSKELVCNTTCLPAAVENMLTYKMEYDKNGAEKSKRILQTVRNFEIIMEYDKRFAGKIRFDEFSQQTYLMGSVPWEERNNFRAWGTSDDSSLFSLIQSDYGLTSRNDFFDAIKIVSRRNRYHPIKEILDGLEWDGEEHISKLLPEYLGTENTPYTREVMKLFMLGAVARIYQPGVKYDYTIIFQGKQGIGKSTFLRLLALSDEWFNDSLDSLDSDKSAQALMGSWIVELAELKSLARTAGGVDSVKRFLSATQDKYRVPYERRADIFLRQCVFAGTTNKSDFLQDETGNRRFLILQTGVNKPIKNLFNIKAMDDIKAAWAEAVHIWKTERPALILPDSVKQEAETLQKQSMADDGKIGIIEEYLKDKQRVCAVEIWQKALFEAGRPQKWQAAEINDIIAQLPEWEKMKSPGRFGEYGHQKGYERKKNYENDVNQGVNQYGDGIPDFVPMDEEEAEFIPFE